MSRKRNLFFNATAPAADAPVAPRLRLADSQLIRTGRGCHFVQLDSDGTVQVTTYKLSHTWSTSEDEFLQMTEGWKTAKIYEEQN